MSDDTSPADLSGLGHDLTEMFRPAWTKADSPQEKPRFTEHEDSNQENGRRPERGARPAFKRPEGRSEHTSGGGRDRGPRREGPGNDRPRREGPGDRGRRAPRHEESRDREERRPEPVAVLEGWTLELVPEPEALEGIAKQVRHRAKAYPLFELSRIILKLSDRYGIRLTPSSPETPGLFRAKADGSLWTSRKEAVDHLLSSALDRFYRKESVTAEPPKGAFTVVAQCGMSGVLLGPPNHHEYTSKVIALHAERFRSMPFESFKARIKMMRDEALIEQWKTEQSTKTVYIPVVPGEETAPPPTADPVEATPTAAPSPTVIPEATEAAPTVGDSPAGESPEATASSDHPTEVSSETPADPSEESAVEAVPEAAVEPPGESSSEPVPTEAPSAEGLSLEEAVAHFLANHADSEIETVNASVTLSGRTALHGSTKLLRELLLRHLRETDRFPLPLAQRLGKELGSQGLQIFKSHKKIIHVSMARPRYLDRQTTPISDTFRAILEYLEAHPNQRRDKQWNALLSLRTGIAPRRPDTTDTTAAPVAPTPESSVASEGASEPVTPVAGLTEEEIKKHEQALGADLLWLLHQGHVIDFAMGNLQAATPPKPQPAKKEREAKETKESMETMAGEEAPMTSEVMTAALVEQSGELADKGAGLSGGAASIPSRPDVDVIREPLIAHDPLAAETSSTLETLSPEDPGQALPS